MFANTGQCPFCSYPVVIIQSMQKSPFSLCILMKAVHFEVTEKGTNG